MSATLPVKPSVTIVGRHFFIRSRPSTLPMKSMPGAMTNSCASLRSVSPLPGSLTDGQQPDGRALDAEAVAGVDGAMVANWAPATRPVLRSWRRRRAGCSGVRRDRDRGGNGRAVDALPRPMRSSADAIVAPVLPGRHHCAPCRHVRLGSTHERGVFLRRTPWERHRPSRSLRVNRREIATTLRAPRARRATLEYPAQRRRAPARISPGDRSPPIASTAIRQHGSLAAQPTSTASAVLYQPQLGHTVCGSFSGAPRADAATGRPASTRQLQWLRVFIFDFFFLGTASGTPESDEGTLPSAHGYERLAARDRRLATCNGCQLAGCCPDFATHPVPPSACR